MIDVQTARRAGVRMCVALYGFGQLRGELVLDGSEATVRVAPEIPAAIGTSGPRPRENGLEWRPCILTECARSFQR